MQLLIYGARSLALGAFRVIQRCAPTYHVVCFLVTSLENNPTSLAGLPVREIDEFTLNLDLSVKENCHILIAAPEDQHPQMVQVLQKYGYHHYTCMNSKKESQWMEIYFARLGLFPSLHNLKQGSEKANVQVLLTQFHKDKELKNKAEFPAWVQPLQVGAALADKKFAEMTDDTGENISKKNRNYCELTALYWLWKNRLEADTQNSDEYYGLFHYRRVLDITEEDLFRLKENDADVILPLPTLHEPDILEHHKRYILNSDWEAMKQALKELHPEYVQKMDKIFNQPYFYNYNLILARKRILADYCAWLFPILMRVEELSEPKGWERGDRYIGYLGENLMTLYFLYHGQTFNIYHAGRLMLT